MEIEMANDKNKINKKNCEMAKHIAKIRDGYVCQRCTKTQNIHGSHIICEKRDHRLACDPNNIIALCYSCHFNFRHKHPVEATKRLETKFPGLMDKLWKIYQDNIQAGSIPMGWVIEQNELLKSQLDKLLGKKPRNKEKI